jgi:hypothetical protein
MKSLLSLMFQVEVQTTRALTEAIQREFQTPLKEVKAKVKGGSGIGTGADAAKPPKFDGTTSWAMFRCQFETAGEHNCWTRLKKSIYLITALQGWTNVKHRVLKAAIIEKALEALEDRLCDQNLAAAYHPLLKMRTQGVRETLHESATAIEHLVHSAYLTLPNDHIKR